MQVVLQGQRANPRELTKKEEEEEQAEEEFSQGFLARNESTSHVTVHAVAFPCLRTCCRLSFSDALCSLRACFASFSARFFSANLSATARSESVGIPSGLVTLEDNGASLLQLPGHGSRNASVTHLYAAWFPLLVALIATAEPDSWS